ncbi:uncharacterized protein BYT42DRAFT_611054 [Radiomyces spectabilis]|uniref:uncharacterized protein n=1 Tax=Radiomyces spectabilis TaxID=64574 RepID=UPI00221EFD44|nr:uncharacterized protein BYT42DRAFT_611054 [Radiomyces spectabilis]KAI8387969.1 hypothetical protein BYT42DRAFT_611054 [Radiomyces spectabilis]
MTSTVPLLNGQQLLKASHNVIHGQRSNWILFKYRTTSKSQTALLPVAQGTEGIRLLRDRLAMNEIQFALLRLDHQLLMIAYIPDHMSNVAKARGSIQAQSLAKLLLPDKEYVMMVVHHFTDLSDTKIRQYVRRRSQPISSASASMTARSAPASTTRPAASKKQAPCKASNLPRIKSIVSSSTTSELQFDFANTPTPTPIPTTPHSPHSPHSPQSMASSLTASTSSTSVSSLSTQKKLPVLSGYLTVQMRESLYWKRRYFKIDGYTLSLFHLNTRVCLQSLPLEHIKYSSDIEEDVIRHSFEVATLDGERVLVAVFNLEQTSALSFLIG